MLAGSCALHGKSAESRYGKSPPARRSRSTVSRASRSDKRARSGPRGSREKRSPNSSNRLLMEPGFRSPLVDFFRRGEVARDVRLTAAQGALAPRAHEQVALLILLSD